MGAFTPMFFKRRPFDDTDPSMPDMGASVPGSTGSASSALSPSRPSPTLQGTQEYQDFADTGAKLRSALQPSNVSMPRALIGAVFARRSPMLASVITGDFQRQRQIQPLEKQYELLGDMITKNRAMSMQDLNMKNIGSEITERGRANDIRQQLADTREAPPPKGLPEQDVAYLQTQVNPDTNRPYTLHEAYAKSLQTAQDTKPENAKGGQLTDIDVGGQNHKVLIDPKDGHVIKDLGQSKLPPPPSPATADNRLDRSYQYNNNIIEKQRKGTDDRLERLDRAQMSLNAKSPQADALIAPELLTVMAGGQGSGLRMNEAEISRIVGGRSNWEALKAAANKWQLDPSKALSITDAQRGQVGALLSKVRSKTTAKQGAFDEAQADLIHAGDVDTHRKITASLKKKLSQIDSSDSDTSDAQSQGGKPAGATHIVPGPDGKNHYTNAQGTVDLGVAP